MQDIIDTARQMADGNHPGVMGENARKELDRVARFLGECQTAMRDFVGTVDDDLHPAPSEVRRYREWFKELLA